MRRRGYPPSRGRRSRYRSLRRTRRPMRRRIGFRM